MTRTSGLEFGEGAAKFEKALEEIVLRRPLPRQRCSGKHGTGARRHPSRCELSSCGTQSSGHGSFPSPPTPSRGSAVACLERWLRRSGARARPIRPRAEGRRAGTAVSAGPSSFISI